MRNILIVRGRRAVTRNTSVTQYQPSLVTTHWPPAHARRARPDYQWSLTASILLSRCDHAGGHERAVARDLGRDANAPGAQGPFFNVRARRKRHRASGRLDARVLLLPEALHHPSDHAPMIRTARWRRDYSDGQPLPLNLRIWRRAASTSGPHQPRGLVGCGRVTLYRTTPAHFRSSAIKRDILRVFLHVPQNGMTGRPPAPEPFKNDRGIEATRSTSPCPQ